MKTFVAALLGLASMLMIVADASAQAWDMPRTADGKPDLQGIWTNATQTPLQRPEEFGLQGFLTAAEAADQEQGWRDRIERYSTPSDPARAAPTDRNTQAGYNGFWIDRGTNAIQINGEYRTSIVVDPANGRIPYLEGDRPTNDLRAQWRAMPGVAPYDAPELRPLGERCLLAFGSSSGPPMLPVMYNNNYQIVQTEDYLLIMVEMVHDARIIPLNQDPHATDLQKWMGDSVGHWEGDTLVVETKNFNRLQSYRGSSDQLTVTERFELIAQDKIKYSFTMEDPLSYQRSWTGEIAMNRRPDNEPMYEYACHEGNYAFAGIMGGARELERQAAQQ